jgi:hypothetical protein
VGIGDCAGIARLCDKGAAAAQDRLSAHALQNHQSCAKAPQVQRAFITKN